jgi:hypothetical protein
MPQRHAVTKSAISIDSALLILHVDNMCYNIIVCACSHPASSAVYLPAPPCLPPSGPIFTDTHSCISFAIKRSLHNSRYTGGVQPRFLATRHSQLSPRRTDRSRNSFRIHTSQVFILKDFNPIRFCTSKPLHLALKNKGL